MKPFGANLSESCKFVVSLKYKCKLELFNRRNEYSIRKCLK